MLFISNMHVLLRLRGGKTVTLQANGSVLTQEPLVQKLLEENSKVVGESKICNGRKIVVLEKRYGIGLNALQYMCLKFSTDGKGSLVGIFDHQARNCKFAMRKIAKMQLLS